MKMIIHALIATLCFTSICHAETSKDHVTNSKMYINPQDIVIEESAMGVHVGNEFLFISTLHRDDRGYFVKMNEIRRYKSCPNGHLTDRADERCYIEGCEYSVYHQ